MYVFLCSSRTLTELLKQPGEAGMLDGTGVHHPIGTNGISARALRSNNGQSSAWVSVYLSKFNLFCCLQMSILAGEKHMRPINQMIIG